MIWYMIWYDMIYMIYDIIWYDIWYDTIWYIWYDIWYMILYDMIYMIRYDIYDTIWYIWYMILYDMIYDMVRYDIYDMIYDIIWYDIWYDTIWYTWYDIFNCNWVATRWQSYSAHIHTQTIQRTTQNKQYIEQHKNTWNTKKYIEQHKNLEEWEPCPVFAGFTLAFALQRRKKHGKPSARVLGSLLNTAIWQYINVSECTQAGSSQTPVYL